MIRIKCEWLNGDLCNCPRYKPNSKSPSNKCVSPYTCKEMSKQIKEALNDK